MTNEKELSNRQRSTFSRRRPPQMSLAFLLGVMLIFAVMMTAGLVYGLRVPAVREEFGWLNSAGSGDANHSAHLQFILFTLTSPLILAGLLSTLMAVLKRVFLEKGSDPLRRG